MPSTISVNANGWFATITLQEKDGAKRATYQVALDRIMDMQAMLTSQLEQNTISQEEFDTKMDLMVLLATETTNQLDADLPVIVFSQ